LPASAGLRALHTSPLSCPETKSGRAPRGPLWNCERNPLRTVADRPISLLGSLLSAWRRQKPRRAPGNSVRILLVVLSKPSVRAPCTWYDGST
jgi:hypothetical protein